MSELVTCPNCLGTGEEVVRGKTRKTCSLCKGELEVSTEEEMLFINNLIINYDEISPY